MVGEQPAIHLQNIGLRRGTRWILRDVNWCVPPGCCAAILGPNGSGKSTLARILAGHLWPTVGQCTILGERYGEVDLSDMRRSIRLLQASGPYDLDPQLSVRDAVLTGFFGTLGLYDPTSDDMEQDALNALRQVGLGELADRPYGTLSSGERVRCLIARALVEKPELLILDEPTSGLDLLGREQVLATIQAMFAPSNGLPPTLVLITHHVEELPPATSHILLLNNGRPLATGSPQEVLRPEILSQIFGCPIDVRASNGRYYLEVNPVAWEQLLHRQP